MARTSKPFEINMFDDLNILAGMPGLRGMEYLDPAIVRGVEAGCGVIFPILLYCLLPAYR